MISAAEAAAAGSSGGQMAGALAAGVETVSQEQTVRFTKYVRVILPLDGFAFWVRADTVSPSAALNVAGLNEVVLDQGPVTTAQAPFLDVKGSLHYSTDNRQDLAEGFSVNRIVFTSLTEVEALTGINPTTLYIGEFDGQRFAFSRRNMLYRQGGLFHYQGDAVYPSMATQIIDNPATIDLGNVVVSNSLPIWLGLNRYMPMYPSYLVPDNIVPSWCAVEISAADTQAIQAAPRIDQDSSHWQLCTDRVRLVVYGLRNATIMDFVDYVNRYSLETDNIGIMNIPTVRDEKATQAELNTLAQKKSIEFEVSYYQARVRQVAQQLIKSAFITIIPE